MRILHCIPSLAGGGAERQLTYLAAALRRGGDDVHVATTSRGANWERLLAAGATTHELGVSRPGDPRLLSQLRAVIRTVDPDVVQVWLRQMDLFGGLASFTRRKPLVVTERSSAAAYPPSVKHYLRVQVGRMADAVVAYSAAGAAYWRERLGERGTIHVIPNIVPIDQITQAPAAAELPFRSERPLVLYAGRLDAEKNVDTLLRALSTALQQSSFDIVFCGTGTMFGSVCEWIGSNHLGERAALLGYTPDLWSLMKRAAVLVSPALFEGSPNVVLEAMAARCPLVVSDIGAHRALLDESSAVFVDPRSPDGIARAIIQVLKAPAEARTRADAAFARAGRFDADTVASAYQQVYRTIVSNR